VERSGWFDDDDPEGEPSSTPREWRHPSELGRFGPYGAPARRRRNATRLAGALTIGGAGTLVLVAAAGTSVFGSANGARTVATESVVGAVAAAMPPTVAIVTTRPRATTIAVLASTTVRPAATTRPATTVRPVASMPPRLGLRVGTAATIPAVIDGDGWIVVGTDELAGATDAEAVLDGGRIVKATVVAVDTDSGVTRLRPAEHLDPPSDQTMAWLGVTCDGTTATGDGAAAGASAASPSTTTTRSDATPSTTALAGPTTIAERTPAPTASDATSRTATTDHSAPTASLAKLATTTEAVRVSTTTATTAAATTTTALATTTTTSAPPTTTTVTVRARPAGAVVSVVHDGSPAAAAGLRVGDVIVAVGARPTRSIWALVLAMRHHEPGDTVQLDLLRDGTTITLDIVLATGPHS
jgi:putative serine protease PepD